MTNRLFLTNPKRILLLITAFYSCLAFADGDIFYQNFHRKDYGNAHVQNWQITQDNRGVIYIANNLGILEYDGISWNLIKIENEERCRSIHKSAAGKIFVGGYDQFGYLATNRIGELCYVSISNKISNLEDYSINLVGNIESLGSKVFFLTDEFIFVYDESKDSIINYIKSTDKALSLHKFNEKMILHDNGGSSFYINDNGSLVKIDWLISDIPNDHLKSIINTDLGCTVVWAKGGIINYDKEFAISNTVYSPTSLSLSIDAFHMLSDGAFAISHQEEGLKILDKDNKELFYFHKENGLIDLSINSIFQDFNDDIWVTTNNGISLLHYSSDIRKYDAKHNMNGGIEAVANFDNKIFIASVDGILWKNIDDERHDSFQQVPLLNQRAWNLDKIQIEGEYKLFASMDDGLYEIHEGLIAEKITNDLVWTVNYNPSYPGYLWEPTLSGLELLHFENGLWRKIGNIKPLDMEIRYFAPEGDSIFWCGNDNKMLIRYVIKNGDFMNGEITVCDSTMGMSKVSNMFPKYIGDSLLFYGDDGIFQFKEGSFQSVNWFNEEEYSKVHLIESDQERGMWIVHYNEQDVFRITHVSFYENYTVKGYREFNPLTEYAPQGICTDPKNTWLGGPNLFRIPNSKKHVQYNKNYHTFIRSINIGTDSLIFGGGFFNGTQITTLDSLNFSNEFKYKYNSIKVGVATNNLTNNDKQEFSYYLQGYDEGWSKWTSLPFVNYTNLPEATYSLKIKAKNETDRISDIATFNFTVLPPWWRTYWAYGLYLVLFSSLIGGITNYRTRQLKKEQIRLEGIVEERTAEIAKQHSQLEQQHELLEEHHKEITDSITYAKGIQESILPSNELIKTLFPNSFVLFKPKDVVSGDFYWADKNESWKYITAADCTGHGVPGAFVSMVGANGLSRSVNEYDLQKPSKILDRLTDLVEETFSQRKDGMDISLIALNFDNTKLQWAGANNPLWLVRSNEKPPLVVNGSPIEPNLSIDNINLYEVKANKQPVGLFENRVPFNNNEIDLLDGDRCFSFTDGYPDQFGGKSGKKFMSKNLKKLFLSLHSVPIEVHEEELLQVFNKWIGDTEQIDDVCVVGIEIKSNVDY